MSTTLTVRAPRARCHECGATELFAVCHHCGRPLCQACAPAVLTAHGRPRSQEFAGLNFEIPIAYHCADCEHMVKGRLWLHAGIGAALAVLGVLLLPLSTGLGIGMLLIGAAVAVGCYLLDRRRLAAAQTARPLLPLLPNVNSVRIQETVGGELVLDRNGAYRTTVAQTKGEFSLSMTFGRTDLDRLALYRSKYRLDTDDVDYCAGFAVLRGQVGLRFDVPAMTGPVLPLNGHTAEHPFFTAPDGQANAQWCVQSGYRLSADREVDALPLWLTPSLVPEADQRSLELEVQWTDFGADDQPLPIERIEQLVLTVPVSWGNVAGTRHRPKVGTRYDGPAAVRRIEWNQINLERSERAARRLTIPVRFEDRIALDDVISGRLTASFKGTLSGLTGVDVLLPLGGRRDEDETHGKPRTRVEADFELSLAGLRYQDVRHVPDRQKDPSKDEAELFPGVIPDDETVAWLTNALSDEQYYVKRVLENPPRSSGRANVVNRYWDIVGRRYDGVYPVDFTMILTGEELHDGDIRARAGNTKIRLSVHGSYATQSMERQVEAEWKRLRDITTQALADRRRSEPADWSLGTADSPEEQTTDRKAGLRKRLDDAEVAMLEGRISEQRYDEIRRRITDELDEL